MVGTKLAHYEILEPLGAGGMGEVYRARDTKLDRDVAIKVLPEDFATDPERLARFEREAKAIAALDHANIVTIYSLEEAFADDGEPVRFITMQLVTGKTLSALIPRNGFSLEKLLDLGIPLADAISAAHRQGITHRDLKPSNIMVSEDGRVRVLDFGLAKLMKDAPSDEDATHVPTEYLTEEGRILGTVAYMSPEQVQGNPTDYRSDVFSLGVILYEAITGEPPFAGESSAELMSSILRDRPRSVTDLNTDFPDQLARVVHRCLEKDPNRRVQTVRDVCNELEQVREQIDSKDSVVGGAPVHAVQAGSRVKPWAIAAAAALALVIILVSLATFWPEATEPASPAMSEPTATTETDRKLIIVFPFDNLGPPDDEYFAEGIAEEITSRLSAVTGLGVISRTTAVGYDRSGKTLKEIGADLAVDYVLEGTVRWQRPADGPSRVRVTPQLIRVADDTHVWSERYEEDLERIFEVQSDVAEQVIQALNVALSRPEREALTAVPTGDMGAYQAYLEGLGAAADWELEDNLRLAAQMFQRAVDLDPEFALAHAKLSLVHIVTYGLAFSRTEELLVAAKRSAERAMELEPGLAEGHLALGYYHLWGGQDRARALEEFSAGARRMPSNSDILNALAGVQRMQGRAQEALANLRKALDFDPRNADRYYELASTYTWLRRYREAGPLYDRAIELAPQRSIFYGTKAMNQILWNGDMREARSTIEQMPREGDPWSLWLRWQALWLERNYEEALALLASSEIEVIEGPLEIVPKALLEARVYRATGNAQQARERFEAARDLLEREAEARPQDARARSALGIAYAGLGRSEEAIREGRRGVDLTPISEYGFNVGPLRVEFLALIYTMVGEFDAAIEQLEYLLSIPSFQSVPAIETNPNWDPLRDHPRYRELIEATVRTHSEAQ